MGMRKERRLQESNSKKKKMIKIIIILLCIVISIFYINLKISKTTSKEPSTSYSANSSDIVEGKKVREAMNAMRSLYKEESPKELKNNLDMETLKEVKKSVDKLDNGKLKDQLINQLNKIREQIN
ncbi:toxin Cry1Ac domain D-VI-related protein [Vagococcus bubulae]|uniref:toxin Cry1Ac domain D-VI-related protein n=1 Tax=Vagococcus bubulae TaxID=1977868 RepID=UPI0022E333EC|nr:toxin Cry1Ac domain D-VI-related protein [Vagococcus bubulae]